MRELHLSFTLEDWLAIGGLAIGVLGLVVAFLQWRSQRIESEPYYRFASHRILGQFERSSPFAAVPAPDLKLTYRGEEIAYATRSFLAFWNHGKKTLRDESILADNPLRLEVLDGLFLGEP